MGACCRSGYPLSPCRPMLTPAPVPFPYAATAEDVPPYPPAPPNLGLSCSSAGESKHGKQPIAGQEETPGRRAASKVQHSFRFRLPALPPETLIAPGRGGGWNGIFSGEGIEGREDGGKRRGGEGKERCVFYLVFGAEAKVANRNSGKVDSGTGLGWPSSVSRRGEGQGSRPTRGFARVQTGVRDTYFTLLTIFYGAGQGGCLL